MAEEHEALTSAFSGLGVDESSLLTVITKWRKQPDKRRGFRSSSPFFKPHGSFERCEDDFVRSLKVEFARFKNITVLWAMHPWERDARWIHHVLHKAHPFSIIVEIACTRSSDELLGARKAYHALFHHSIEEDVAYRVKENYCSLLVGLVSAYRYEGSRVDEDIAKSEAKALGHAIKNAGTKDPVENYEVIRILTTRSKTHLIETFRHYSGIHGKSIEQDFADESCLGETVRCLGSSASYFSKVIDKAFGEEADKNAKDALTRVVVSRSDVDMEEIKAVYEKQYKAKLEDKIAKNTRGNYRDALLSLVGM
ncbi:hypothetical protein C4D60_Mb03t18610 [Musa balbisiana]|uniref:Annexin n=1 Tax=Musa balbisiana TaxID=52838 RepID=A0A4S8JAS9_MUSBA|nr:hypothetical protein C4D60_Mb03t18610 [Musa balbisiana]